MTRPPRPVHHSFETAMAELRRIEEHQRQDNASDLDRHLWGDGKAAAVRREGGAHSETVKPGGERR